MKTIVLLSGGIDSSVALYWSIHQGWDISGLTFDIRQTSRMDIQAALQLSQHAGIREHKIIPLDFYNEFKVHPDLNTRGKQWNNISAVYLPVRNAIFYSIAAGWAETIGAQQIIAGSNKEDGDILPDARKEFFEQMNNLFQKGSKSAITGQSIKILTPLIHMTNVEVLQKAIEYKIPLEKTWTCQKNEPPSCGKCENCHLRLIRFEAIGISDPIPYEK